MGSNPCACALWVTHRAHRTCVELPSEPPHPPSTPLHPSSTSAGLHPNLHQHPAKHPAALNPTSHPRTSTCQLAPAEASASARVSVVRLTACARCCRAPQRLHSANQRQLSVSPAGTQKSQRGVAGIIVDPHTAGIRTTRRR